MPQMKNVPTDQIRGYEQNTFERGESASLLHLDGTDNLIGDKISIRKTKGFSSFFSWQLGYSLFLGFVLANVLEDAGRTEKKE